MNPSPVDGFFFLPWLLSSYQKKKRMSLLRSSRAMHKKITSYFLFACSDLLMTAHMHRCQGEERKKGTGICKHPRRHAYSSRAKAQFTDGIVKELRAVIRIRSEHLRTIRDDTSNSSPSTSFLSFHFPSRISSSRNPFTF